jgi:mannose/fructose-specific phosphotransferase system component IIA
MVGIVIISHGKLASALKTTSEMICGCQSQVETVEFLEGMTPEEL